MKNTFVKVLSFMMALAMIVGMFSTLTISAAEHVHTKGDKPVKVVEPTCMTLGYTSYKCTECGEEFIPDDEVIMPSSDYHKVEEIEATPASCLTPGYSAGKACTVEGCTYVPEGSDRVATGEAQKEHAFKQVVTEATCTTNKKIEYVCTSCNLSVEKIAEKVAKGETAWLDSQKTAPDTLKAVEIADTALDAKHEKLVWTIVTAPVSADGKCTDGQAKGTCKNCDFTKEAVIPVKHTYTVELNPNGASCAQYVKGSMACAVCGKIDPDAVKNENVTNHGDAVNVWNWTVTFDPENLPTKKNGTKFTLSELYNLGFSIGDKFGKEPTCTTAGSQLVECRCGQIFIGVVPAKGHALENFDLLPIIWPTKCTDPAKKVAKCGACDYTETKIIKNAAASAHTLKDNVTAPTCTTVGYTETVCTNKFVANGVEVTCAHNTGKHSYVDALGHAWGTATYVEGSGKCGSATVQYKKTCTVKDCDAYEYVAEPAGTTCNVVTTTVPATCVKASYQTKICSICKDGTGVEYPIEGAKPDANAHVLVPYVVGGVTQYVSGKAPTCTAGGVGIFWCVSCDKGEATITTKDVPAIDHTYVAGSGVNKDDDGNFVSVITTKQPAMCDKVGYKADGEFCSMCGLQKKAPTEIAKDPANHSGTVTAIGSLIEATCQSNAKQMYNTTCCGFITEEIANTKVANCVYVDVAYKAPTCTTAGNHAYKACKWCGAKQAWTTTTAGCSLNCASHTAINSKLDDNHEIAKLGHKWGDKQGDVVEGCLTTGIKAYYECTRCDLAKIGSTEYDTSTEAGLKAFEADKVILPHYNQYKVVKTAVAATCTSKEIIAGTYCTKCQKNAWVGDYAAHDYLEFEVNPKTIDGVANPDWDCTADYCHVKVCMVCGDHTTTYTKAGNATHTLPTDWTVVTPTYTCKEDTVQVKHCTVEGCFYEVKEVKTAATGCWTTKGSTAANAQKFPMSYKCTEIENFIDMTCGCCGTAVTAETIPTLIKHNVVTETKAATCDKDGYTIEYCADCHDKKLDKTTIIAKLATDGKHTEGTLVELVPATATTDGHKTYVCTECTAEARKYNAKAADVLVTEVIPATATLVVGGAVSATTVTAGTTVTYTVSYSALAQEITELKINVSYDDGKFDLVSVETALEGVKVYATEAGNDTIGVSFIVPNNANGEKQKITTSVEGTDLFTLTFVAKAYANGEATFGVEADTDKVKVAGRGNLNGDAIITVEDATAVTAKFGTTDAAADINGDGIVDIDDLALVATFAASAQTAKDYLVMLGTYAEIEETINALYEGGKLADVNKDNTVNINDLYYLTLAVDSYLASYDSYEDINFSSAEEFVMLVMNLLVVGTRA